MNLTSQEKEKYFNKYEQLLWQTVHRFKARCSSSTVEQEDLFNECVIILYEHAASAKTLEQLHKIPVLTMVHAMSMYVLGCQALSYPKRTFGYSKLIQSFGKSDTPQHDTHIPSYDNEEDILEQIDFDRFAESLTPSQRQVVTLKRNNYTNREAARTLGIRDSSITQTIQRVKKLYETHTVNEDNLISQGENQ